MNVDSLRKSFFIFLMIINFSLIQQVFASDIYIEGKTPSDKKCNLSMAGFESKDIFIKLYNELNSAMKLNDKEKIRSLVIYPFTVNGKTVQNKQELIKNHDSIFTDKVKKAVLEQSFNNLFCRDQGVMFGNGELWVGVIDGKAGIKAINNKDLAK